MAKRITYILLISIFISFGFGQLMRFEISGFTVYLHDVLVVASILINTRVLKRISVPAGVYLMLIGTVVGLVRAGTVYPVDAILTPILYSLRIAVYILFYLVIAVAQIPLHRNVYVATGWIVCTVGLIQYMFMPDMRWAQYLGWDDHLHRITLPHFDPTFTAIALGMPLLSQKNLITLTSVALGLTFMLTYARSAWLSLILTAAIGMKNIRITLAILGIIVLSILILPRRFGEGTNITRTFSIGSRVAHDIEIAKNLGWDAITGRGAPPYIFNTVSDKGFPNHASSANNSYLAILSQWGVLGLLGWVLFIRSLYRGSQYKYIIVFVCVASLFNNVLLYPFVLLYVLIQNAVTAPSEV